MCNIIKHRVRSLVGFDFWISVGFIFSGVSLLFGGFEGVGLFVWFVLGFGLVLVACFCFFF